MMLSARRQFLEAYLGAMGVAEITEYEETADEARGVARLAPDEERLDFSSAEDDDLERFRWPVTEAQAPAPLVYHLADIIHRYHLLEVDRLRVSRDMLYTIFLQDAGVTIAREELEKAWKGLTAIRVWLGEEGEEEAVAMRD